MSEEPTDFLGDFANFTNSLSIVKYDIGQNILSYKSPKSLEFISLTKIAISLWQQQDVQEKYIGFLDLYYSKCSFEHIYRDHWRSIENETLKKISSLMITTYCKEALKGIVKEVGKQLLKYIADYEHPGLITDQLKKSYMNQICWTYQGTVNKLKTAESLVNFMDLSVEKRYIIACNSCLEDKILELYEQLPPTFKIDPANPDLKLASFWTSFLKCKHKKGIKNLNETFLYKNCKTHMYSVIRWIIRYKNEVALHYIWNNFASTEVKINLVSHAELTPTYRFLCSDTIDIFCFLLLQMQKEQIRALFSKYFYKILKVLLDDWRWYDVFLTTARFLLQFLKSMKAYDAFNILFCWRESVFDKRQYRSLFVEIIEHFQTDIKNDFFNICHSNFEYIFSKDAEIYKLFLSKVSLDEKKKYMYTSGTYHCSKLLMEGELDYADICVREMLETEEEINRFKKYFWESNGSDVCSDMIMSNMYEEVDSMLNRFVHVEQIPIFKKIFVCMKGGFILDFYKHKDDRTKFLNWCFSGNEEEISDYWNEPTHKLKPTFWE